MDEIMKYIDDELNDAIALEKKKEDYKKNYRPE